MYQAPILSEPTAAAASTCDESRETLNRRSGAHRLEILVAMPTSLHEGDQALILEGPFAGKVGTITRIDSESATVVCDVFDRDTPVHVGLNDVASIRE